ncbi:MAG TPA: hypothetical protein VEG34_05555 [Thermoanaerobaculia bacterium]|nr:hypothetical protein [Thermoanaerobaculia bacterium]
MKRSPQSPLRLFNAGAALGALTLLAAVPAAAQTGSLRFDRLTVETCNEMGSCEVRLACKLGNGAEVQLIPEVVIAPEAFFGINRTEAVARYPVTVSCRVWEDDGIFGSSWEEVGSGSLTVPAGGTYELELGNAEQVQVVLQISADSLEGPPGGGRATAAPAASRGGKAKPAAAPAGRRYSGTFRANPDTGHAVVLGLDGAAFRSRYKDWTGKGLRLVDFETYVEGKTRRWNGIFRSGKEGHELVTDLEWEPFKAKYEELQDKGQKLIDLETYVDGKKRLFAALYRETPDPASLWVGEEEKVFINKVNEFTGQGLRLIDVEAYRSGNKLLYAGAFLKGIGSFGLSSGMEWPALQAKTNDATGKGQRLADFESYEDGKKRLYVGVYRGGSDKSELAGDLAWADFESRWKQLTGQGLRLVDLESLPE